MTMQQRHERWNSPSPQFKRERKNFSDKTVFAGIAAILVLQTMFVYASFVPATFGSAPLTIDDILKSILVGAITLPANSVEECWRSRG